ncbi:glycosyltransferase family 1 protein [Azospirillum sp. B506]|uniref:glycosyltransferase family 4 protein n=1 Tax=Azospirillum sp. B506 TaxID=137721 RepID=UPI001FCAF103|nr:glycosyltransferase family 1 protein [Azospirillum sp. B506]
MVAIEGTTFHGPEAMTGIGRYVRNMARSLARIHAEQGVRLLATVGRLEHAALLADTVMHDVRAHLFPPLLPEASVPASRLRTFDRLEQDLIGLGATVYFDPNPFALYKNFFMPKRLRHAVMVHDLVPLTYRSAYFENWPDSLKVEYMRRLTHLAEAADVVLFPSQATAEEFRRLARPRPGLVQCVTGEGVDPVFLSPAAADTLAPAPVDDSGHAAARPYMLIVSNPADPRKNLGFTLTAFRHFLTLAASTRHVAMGLEIVMASDALVDQTQAHCRALGLGDRVRLRLGPTDAELRRLYRDAALLVCPSAAEGFGLPVIEALACGTPVLSSNRAGLGEFECDGWIMPGDLSSEAALAAGMLQALDRPRADPETARRYAAQFDWNAVAARTYRALSPQRGPHPSSPTCRA